MRCELVLGAAASWLLFAGVTAYETRRLVPSEAQARRTVPPLIVQAPDAPAPRTQDQPWMSLEEWERRRQALLRSPERATAQAVLIGDSITEGVGGVPELWSSTLGRLGAAAFGVGGDETQHVLFRLAQGELAGMAPRCVLLLIGVNNLGNSGHTPIETVRGIRAVASAVRAAAPGARVVVLELLPAGQTALDPFRVRVEATNDALRKSFELTPFAGVTLERVGDVLLSPSGELSGELASDFLHPTPAGYARLLNALVPIVERCRTAPARQP